MTTAAQSAPQNNLRYAARWSIAGQFLEALAQRDFDALSGCLHADIRFRGLVPSGPFELHGPTDTTHRFRRWFDGPDELEFVDASIGQVGPRLYLRWQVRMHPPRDPESDRLVEQHAFATIGKYVELLDLLCSGFHPSAH